MKKKKGMINGLGIKIAGIGAIIIIVLSLLNGALINYTVTVGTERAISNFSTDIAENIANHIDPKDYERFLEE